MYKRRETESEAKRVKTKSVIHDKRRSSARGARKSKTISGQDTYIDPKHPSSIPTRIEEFGTSVNQFSTVTHFVRDMLDLIERMN